MTTTATTLVELLADAVANWRTRGYRFLEGEGEPARLSYADLDTQARALAAELAVTMAPGSRAVLVYPPGLEFIKAFFAVLDAGVIAVPIYPPLGPKVDDWAAHFERILRDARVDAVLTTEAMLALKADAGLELGSSDLAWIATDRVVGGGDGWTGPTIRAGDVALIQYTSGSTARPKGVVLTHENVMANQRAIAAKFQLTSDTVAVLWLPMYHDMGLVGGVIHALYTGLELNLMSPLDFLQRPLRWLQAMSSLSATATGAPNFAYELCIKRTSEQDRAALDLSSWEIAFTAGEAVKSSTMRRFSTAFEPSGFRPSTFMPCYGLAEATVFVTGDDSPQRPRNRRVQRSRFESGDAVEAARENTDAAEIVALGTPGPGHQVVVVDPESGAVRPDDTVGEIWVSGPSVALGYWRQPDETERIFNARLPSGEGPFVRTGDLGFSHQGDLFVCGRTKELIIIRGRNVYPQDIEEVAQSTDGRLRAGCGAAFAVESAAGDSAVLVHETSEGDPGELAALGQVVRAEVARVLQIQLAAVVLVAPRTVPKTTSGKLQRLRCRDMYLDGGIASLDNATKSRTSMA